MNILLWEDRGEPSNRLEDSLSAQGHNVYVAFAVSDAETYWEDEAIECLVLDLNMDPYGLTEEEMAQTADGVLTGWIWVKGHVLQDHPEMRERTIIYSDYLPQLREKAPSQELVGLTLVPKRGPSFGTILLNVDRIHAELRKSQT